MDGTLGVGQVHASLLRIVNGRHSFTSDLLYDTMMQPSMGLFIHKSSSCGWDVTLFGATARFVLQSASLFDALAQMVLQCVANGSSIKCCHGTSMGREVYNLVFN